MAKAKSPKTTSIRSKKTDKPNGAPAIGLDVPASAEPATQAEKAAAGATAGAAPRPAKEISSPAPVPAPAAKTSVEPLPTAAKDLEAAIRQRAYQIFLERRGKPGDAREDWARAEREVLDAFQHQKSA